MGEHRVGTAVMGLGGAGVLVGHVLTARFPASDTFHPDSSIPLVWYDDSDFRVSVVLTLVVLGLVGWHHRRFGIGKLAVIGVLSLGSLLGSIGDFGTGEPVWAWDLAGDELIGAWLRVASSGLLLAGVVWSATVERPGGTKTWWAYVFGGGPGGSRVTTPQAGMVVDDAHRPPDGWWRASDGRWYPPGRPDGT